MQPARHRHQQHDQERVHDAAREQPRKQDIADSQYPSEHEADEGIEPHGEGQLARCRIVMCTAQRDGGQEVPGEDKRTDHRGASLLLLRNASLVEGRHLGQDLDSCLHQPDPKTGARSLP